jgi:hypothetical protein
MSRGDDTLSIVQVARCADSFEMHAYVDGAYVASSSGWATRSAAFDAGARAIAEWWAARDQSVRCIGCHELTGVAQLDPARIPPGAVGNLVILCAACNAARRERGMLPWTGRPIVDEDP